MNGIKATGTHYSGGSAERERIRIGRDEYTRVSSSIIGRSFGKQGRCLHIQEDISIGVAI